MILISIFLTEKYNQELYNDYSKECQPSLSLNSYSIPTVSMLKMTVNFTNESGFALASKVTSLLGMGLLSCAVATVVISVQKELIERELQRTKDKLTFLNSELGRRRSSIFPRFSTVPTYPIEEKVSFCLVLDLLKTRRFRLITVYQEKFSRKDMILLSILDQIQCLVKL